MLRNALWVTNMAAFLSGSVNLLFFARFFASSLHFLLKKRLKKTIFTYNEFEHILKGVFSKDERILPVILVYEFDGDRVFEDCEKTKEPLRNCFSLNRLAFPIRKCNLRSPFSFELQVTLVRFLGGLRLFLGTEVLYF